MSFADFLSIHTSTSTSTAGLTCHLLGCRRKQTQSWLAKVNREGTRRLIGKVVYTLLTLSIRETLKHQRLCFWCVQMCFVSMVIKLTVFLPSWCIVRKVIRKSWRERTGWAWLKYFSPHVWQRSCSAWMCVTYRWVVLSYNNLARSSALIWANSISPTRECWRCQWKEHHSRAYQNVWFSAPQIMFTSHCNSEEKRQTSSGDSTLLSESFQHRFKPGQRALVHVIAFICLSSYFLSASSLKLPTGGTYL